MAFFREAQLALRHADQAVRSAQQSRLTGSVSLDRWNLEIVIVLGDEDVKKALLHHGLPPPSRRRARNSAPS